jgi:hypothetical protein
MFLGPIWRSVMAKKKGVKVNTSQTKPQVWAIRLEMDEDDHERIARIARALKLSKAGFARMAVMDRVRLEEARVKE